MKQLIAPIAIIVALIAFFVIIDRKDFYPSGDVAVQNEAVTGKKPTMTTVKPVEPPKEMKPIAETKHVETKTVAATKSTTVKPVENKPVAETKPVETKPVVETIPAGVKPAEVKQPETKTVAEEKLVHAGIPVVTAEEAEKLNAEALVEFEKLEKIWAKERDRLDRGQSMGTPAKIRQTEPLETETSANEFIPYAVPVLSPEKAEKANSFACFLLTAGKTTVEGEIIERSDLPDPQKSDYPNCRFTAHFLGNSIKSGESCPKEISLIIEGFSDYIVLDNNKIKAGDKIECLIVPFDNLPEEFKSTQQADDLNLFLLENYYVFDVHKIDSFADNAIIPKSGIYFSDSNEEYISIFKRNINPPISPNNIEEQKRFIHNELKKMTDLLKDFDEKTMDKVNAMFSEAWELEKKKDPPNYNRIKTNNSLLVWRNIENSFWVLPENYRFENISPLSEATLDCLLALKKACEDNGVIFILTLVPERYVISSRVVIKEARTIPDFETALFVKQCLEHDIDTFYAADCIIENFNRFPFAYIFPTDKHPADTTQDIMTDLLKERIIRYGVKPDLDPSLFEERFVESYGNLALYPQQCDIGDHTEGKEYTFRQIWYDNKRIQRSPNGRIMVIGNSFANIPHNSPCSLLSYKLHCSIDWNRVSAYGPFNVTMAAIIEHPDLFLKDKQVLIMYIGTEHLAEVNRKNFMDNIAQLDYNRLLINGRKKIQTFPISSTSTDDSTRAWIGTTAVEKRAIKSIQDSDSPTHITTIELTEIDNQKDCVCIVRALSQPEASVNIVVNTQKKGTHGSSRFQNYAFLIPANTKEIHVSCEGKSGTKFSIKEIEIWQ